MDSNDALITTQEHVHRLDGLPALDRTAFDIDIQEELAFLLKDCVRPIPLESADLPPNATLQPLKWILAIKHSTYSQKSAPH